MPISLRLDPAHLEALAGNDVVGTIVLDNPGDQGVQARLVITEGEGDGGLGLGVAGWASVEPSDAWVAPGARVTCQVRFRLPRGAPGGVGTLPFSVTVLSDQEGEGGASVDGTLEISGEAELAIRLIPSSPRGCSRASARVAVDNLGASAARVQLSAGAGEAAVVEVVPDSLVVEPGATEFAHLIVRPSRRLVKGGPRSIPFSVRLDPLGGAQVSGAGAMVQRSLVASWLPKLGAGAVLLLLVALLVRSLGDDGATDLTTTLTSLPTTSTTATPTTVAPESQAGTPAPSTAVPLTERRLAFQSKRDGQFEIYSANPDGTDARNLSQNPFHDSEPAWSPDHTTLAFDSDRAGNFDVYVMNADGTGAVQLTSEPAPDGYPAWSPDGTKIAFVSFRDGNSEIYVMNADGSNPKRLTKNATDDSHPAWAPDGSLIAFHSNQAGNFEIHVMRPEGGEATNLSNNPGADQNPAWSPNGARLAFDSTRDGGKPELYVMGADGSLPTRLTTNDDLDTWPVWSPDGGRLAFQSDSMSDVEIYVVAAGGGQPRRLTESPGDDGEPAW